MSRKGFTLIELLIVVVIIGILATIAIPKFGQSRDRAYVSAMQADINQMRRSMELCYHNAFTYVGCTPNIRNSRGVEFTVEAQTTSDYTLQVTHTATENWSCSYTHDSGAAPGQIVCVEA